MIMIFDTIFVLAFVALSVFFLRQILGILIWKYDDFRLKHRLQFLFLFLFLWNKRIKRKDVTLDMISEKVHHIFLSK